ncbi:MAG TPA: YqeG family HAD IIIA-type phosphatase [Bacillota bacterium]|nr:YqeG family HAD IIIA-type phosphatase [Bacillota bacterium]
MNWSRPLVPDAWVPEITALDPQVLRGRGFRGLIADLDNTLAEWNDAAPTPAVATWLQRAEAAGLRVCILSNNGGERVAAFARGTGLPSVAGAGKPRRGGYRRALGLLGTAASETVMVGDQIWTDVLGARRMGMYAILVQPLAPREFIGTRSIRWLERAWVAHLKRGGALGLPFLGG